MPATKGLSYAEALALGVGHEHPEHPDRKGAARRRVPRTNDKGQNKTEADFDHYLSALKARCRIADYRFEPLKLRLAGRTWYRIDFVVKRLNDSLAALEVKGHMEDDAAVKLKVAPVVFPFMDYYLVRRDRSQCGGWDVREVTGLSGIGTVPIRDTWID